MAAMPERRGCSRPHQVCSPAAPELHRPSVAGPGVDSGCRHDCGSCRDGCAGCGAAREPRRRRPDPAPLRVNCERRRGPHAERRTSTQLS
eukprot:4192718-Prymnesium_polylepis.1